MPIKTERGGECIQQWGVVIEKDQAVPSTDKEWFMEMPSIVTHTLGWLVQLTLVTIDN